MKLSNLHETKSIRSVLDGRELITIIKGLERGKSLFIGDSGRIYMEFLNKVRIGITNKLKNGKYFFAVDMDKIRNMEAFYAFMPDFIKNNHLSNIYLFKTSRGRYALFSFPLGGLSWNEYCDMLCKIDCCVNFRYYTMKSKLATIRITKKQEKKTSTIQLANTFETANVKENIKLKKSVFKLIGFES